MQKIFPEDVKAIALNVDHEEADAVPTESLQAQVRDKLVELGLDVENVMCSDAYDDVLEHYNLFSLPATLVYRRDGKLVRTFEGEFSYADDVLPLVEELLGQGK